MYTTTVRSARITYTKLNRLLFEGKLPPSSQIVFDIGGINNSWAYCQKIKDGVKIKLTPTYKSKHFFITILAHEMVHVKQYAKGEMKDIFRPARMVKWHGVKYNIEETDYWELPFEIEAYGREKGLYIKFMNYLRTMPGDDTF
mgnify:CR=1 FL=1